MVDFNWKDLFGKLVQNLDLTEEESGWAMTSILDKDATDAQIGAFLIGLKAKGETPLELAGFLKVIIQKSVKCDYEDPESLLDTCGTGGDGSGTFNISTAAALVLAGCGVKVAKHGNRAATSQSGSADVLEALGVAVDLGPTGVKKCIDESNLGFFLAQRYHPAFKAVGQIRKDLGVPTAFNMLGPMANPARATNQLIGVTSEVIAEKVRDVLAILGTKRALIVTSKDGLDEISTIDITKVYTLSSIKGYVEKSSFEIDPSNYGFKAASRSDLAGGTPDQNAIIIRRILEGEKGFKRDVVILNAAAGLTIVKKAEEIEDAIDLAADAIDSGKAAAALEKLIDVSNSESAREKEN